MKKSLIIPALTLFLINFVSAAAYGYYGGSLGDALNRIDPTTIVLVLLFMIFFTILNYGLGRIFKDSRGTAGVIAFAASLIIIYGIWRAGFDLENIFGDFGASSDLLYTILPLLVIAGIIFLILKYKRKSLLIFGALLIGLSFFTYEKTLFIILGGILFIIGIFVSFGKKKTKSPQPSYAGAGI